MRQPTMPAISNHPGCVPPRTEAQKSRFVSPQVAEKNRDRRADLHNFGAPVTTFRINTYISVASKGLYLPLESTLMKKGGEGEGGLWLTFSGFRRTPSPRNPLAPGLCPVPCPGLVGVAN